MTKTKRSEEYSKAADELSRYVAGLNLPAGKNNRLAVMIKSIIEIAERDAYKQASAPAVEEKGTERIDIADLLKG